MGKHYLGFVWGEVSNGEGRMDEPPHCIGMRRGGTSLALCSRVIPDGALVIVCGPGNLERSATCKVRTLPSWYYLSLVLKQQFSFLYLLVNYKNLIQISILETHNLFNPKDSNYRKKTI